MTQLAENLGTASGAIRLDLSDLQRAIALSAQAGQQVTANLNRINTGARASGQGVQSVSSALGKMSGALGVVGGVLTALKLAKFALEVDTLATAYKRQSVAAVSLAGSQIKLNELLATYDRVTGGAIDKATAMADVTRLQAVGFADSAAELEQFTTAVRGMSVAMGKDQDYISSQLILEMTNQRGARLDQIGLNKPEVLARVKELQAANSGLTKEMAYQNAVLDVANKKFGDLVKSQVAQATGQEKAAKGWKDFKLALGDALGPATGAIMQFVADDLNRISDALKAVKDKADEAGKALGAVGNELPPWLSEGAKNIRASMSSKETGNSFGTWLNDRFISQMLPSAPARVNIQRNIDTSQGDRAHVQSTIDALRRELAGGSSRSRAEIEADLARQAVLLNQVNAQLEVFKNQLFHTGSVALTGDRGDISRVTPANRVASIDPNLEAQQADIVAHYVGIQQIERDANTARLEATKSYESSRSETIRGYEQSIARDAEDFGRQRARAAAQLEKEIADVGIDAAKQAAKWQEDLVDSIAKMQKDSGDRIAEAQEASNKRIAEINENYKKSRERAERDHHDNLLEAAANLDARAVFEEQKNYARSSADAKDAHDDALKKESEGLAERTSKEQENLAERIDEAQKANAKQLADAKEADAERIADMRQNQLDQQKIEDEDRAIRLQREAEDHAAQLAQMDAAQGERLAQIDAHAAEERTKLDEEFLKQLDEDGKRNEKWFAQQEALKGLALKQFDDWWKHILGAFGKVQGPISQADKNQFIDPDKLKGFASGGGIAQTGAILAHAGEYMFDRNTVDRLGGWAGMRQITNNGGRTNTLNLGAGSIIVNAAAGMDEYTVARIVKSELLNVLENELN